MKTSAAIVSLLLASSSGPCIWDSDTLADELRGLPDGLRLLTGRWHRHSADYYAARVAKLPARLDEHGDDLAAYDDLAVAHERLGDRDAALRVMDRKRKALDALAEGASEALATTLREHRYRELANRGTFLAHAGRFDEALESLVAALALNPAAHFGRERWQIAAIRYVAACRREPSLWTTHDFLSFANVLSDASGVPVTGRSSYTAQRLPDARVVAWDELHTAVVGMLRFGGLEGAELYRTLGDLHLAKQDLHLAWWAYGVALERGHAARESIEAARQAIVEHWQEAAVHNRRKLAIPTDDEFRRVRASAARWLAEFHRLEREALARGADVASDAVLKELLARADAAVEELLPAAAAAGAAARPGAEAPRGKDR